MLAVFKLHLSTCLLLIDSNTTDFFFKFDLYPVTGSFKKKNLIICSELLWVFNVEDPIICE